MSAPSSQMEPTGRAGRFAVVLVGLIIILVGSIWYAQRSGMITTSLASSQADTEPLTNSENTDDASEPDETPQVASASTETNSQAATATYTVTSVVDGDTIKVTRGGITETVRLIGVDTPETKDPRKSVQCFGREASVYSESQLAGKTVQLEADDSQDDIDKYGRLLRYVLLADESNFNEQLISAGYAYEYTYKIPYRFQSEFQAAQSDAQAAQRGLWSPQTCNGKR